MTNSLEAPHTVEWIAHEWLRSHFFIDDSRVDPEEVRIFLEKEQKRSNERVGTKMDNAKEIIFAKIATRPELTREELVERSTETRERFGDTNNFYMLFKPDILRGMKEKLQEGKLEQDNDFDGRLYFLVKNGHLEKAFEKIGFERSRELVLDLEYYFQKEIEWMKRLGQNPAETFHYGYWPPELSLISEEERKLFIDRRIRAENNLRQLAIALHEQGIRFGTVYM